MSDKSAIEWTEATWNPIVGCSIVSPGCTNCYAMRMAARIEKMNRTGGSNSDYVNHYDGTTKATKAGAVWTGKIACAPAKLFFKPLSWKRPRRVFVNSMGDLFHEDIPDDLIDRVFAIMALCPQHTFQVLTKRAERMRDYFLKRRALDVHPLEDRELAIDRAMDSVAPQHWFKRELQDYSPEGLPLPNVWFGVSAERQQEADERIPLLLQTPAAIRFVSAEPLLGPIDFTSLRENNGLAINSFTADLRSKLTGDVIVDGRFNKLDWIIVGGESGPGARPFDTDWARTILNQCSSFGVAAFMKQLGSNPYTDGRPMHSAPKGKYDDPDRWPPELRVRQFPTIKSKIGEAA